MNTVVRVRIRFVRVGVGSPVESYIVRPGGLRFFDEGSKTFKYYGGFPRARRHHFQELRLPFEGPWYLVIVNRSRTEPARVKYNVSY